MNIASSNYVEAHGGPRNSYSSRPCKDPPWPTARATGCVREGSIGAVKWQSQAQHLVLVNRLFDGPGAGAAPFLGPPERDVTCLVESLMPFEQPFPAGIVAHVEHTRDRPRELIVMLAENLG